MFTAMFIDHLVKVSLSRTGDNAVTHLRQYEADDDDDQSEYPHGGQWPQGRSRERIMVNRRRREKLRRHRKQDRIADTKSRCEKRNAENVEGDDDASRELGGWDANYARQICNAHRCRSGNDE